MPSYSVAEPWTDVLIQDEPLGYNPARGKRISFTLYYRQRAAIDEVPNTVFGVGQNWSCSFRAFITPGVNAGEFLLHRGGGGYLLYVTNAPNFEDGSVLTTNAGPTYQITFRRGDVWTFGQAFPSASPTYWFLTSQADPAGNTVTYSYSTDGSSFIKLSTVQDPNSGTTTLTYGSISLPLQITAVTDPYLRSCTLQYDLTSGQLTNITDEIGIQSSFIYDSALNRSTWITNMATPYGNTGAASMRTPTFFTTHRTWWIVTPSSRCPTQGTSFISIGRIAAASPYPPPIHPNRPTSRSPTPWTTSIRKTATAFTGAPFSMTT
jgi:hypothetical protein